LKTCAILGEALLLKVRGEQALQDYIAALEQGEFNAIVDISLGGASVVGSVAIIVFFPPSTAGGWALTGTVIGFASDEIAGGIRTINAIRSGLFDPNKEYKPVKGVIMGMAGDYGEYVGFAYDVGSIVTSFKIGLGAWQEIRNLESIYGNELEVIIKGYVTGIETVSVGEHTYKLKEYIQ
jgi:hypothetical protein